MKNCKILGDTSIAVDINHTLNKSQHKKKLAQFEIVIKTIFKNKNILITGGADIRPAHLIY